MGSTEAGIYQAVLYGGGMKRYSIDFDYYPEDGVYEIYPMEDEDGEYCLYTEVLEYTEELEIKIQRLEEQIVALTPK